MRPATQTTDLQQALIREAETALARDDRILACWLEGSFAGGTSDPWSDIDLHVAVGDEHWDGLLANRLAVLGGVRPVLGSVEARMPWGAHLVSANLSGPVRVDLFIEKRSLLSGRVAQRTAGCALRQSKGSRPAQNRLGP